jgi:electron transfer flavoprotein alpha subunit
VSLACDVLTEKGIFSEIASDTTKIADEVPPPALETSTTIGVIVEPGRSRLRAELLGHAAVLAGTVGATVTAIVPGQTAEMSQLGREGAGEAALIESSNVAADVADATAAWCERTVPWAVLAPSTLWGREVAGRVSARLRAGLIGDAIDLEVKDARLICWKPAFGGQISAAITSHNPTQITTIRPGVLPVLRLRAERECSATMPVNRRCLVDVVDSERGDVGLLGSAGTEIGVGARVAPGDYGQLDESTDLLGANLGATRKVTDKQLIPLARQIGVTGRSIARGLYMAIGISGKLNHMRGVRAPGTIPAINPDPQAPVFGASDVGMVAEWKRAVPLLCRALRERMEQTLTPVVRTTS